MRPLIILIWKDVLPWKTEHWMILKFCVQFIVFMFPCDIIKVHCTIIAVQQHDMYHIHSCLHSFIHLFPYAIIKHL